MAIFDNHKHSIHWFFVSSCPSFLPSSIFFASFNYFSPFQLLFEIKSLYHNATSLLPPWCELLVIVIVILSGSQDDDNVAKCFFVCVDFIFLRIHKIQIWRRSDLETFRFDKKYIDKIPNLGSAQKMEFLTWGLYCTVKENCMNFLLDTTQEPLPRGF